MGQQVNVRLKDGSQREYEAGTTFADIAASISPRLGKEAVVAKVNGKVVDLGRTVDDFIGDKPVQTGNSAPELELELLTLREADGVDAMRHTAAHVMAQAVARVFPGTKFAIGPVIEHGFYYDFSDHDFTADDLPKIEAEMQKVIQADFPVVREVISRDAALEMFRERDDRFKVEIIQDLPQSETITIYKQGEFVDLCRGPHVPSTGRIKAFKLMSIAGAYWRGDSDREMLTRVYATAFGKKSELDDHLKLLEEAKKRDHRKLGRELELFMFSDDAPGMPIYLPNGLIIRNELERFERGLQVRAGYEEVKTPIILNQRLWEQSGHWDHYTDNMYVTRVDEELFALKPMNCPGHFLVYKHKQRSYRDLPVRIAEYGQVHRHELSGTLGGMMRVRTFTQDDAHIFCRPDQIGSEIESVLALVETIYGAFGFTYHVELSTRPEDSMGAEAVWEEAERALGVALEEAGVSYRVNPGDGAFYGPKIDFHIKDAIGRTWQCATVQLDFQMPERFDLTYVGSDNGRYRPVVIHRAIFGSIDRFMGILTEHFSGAFPAWIAPVQVRVLSVADDFGPYADRVVETLRDAGFRAQADTRSEKIGYKIREAQMHKTPYTLVVGEREQTEQSVSVRRYGEGDQGQEPVDAFLGRLQAEVESKRLLA